MDQDHTLPKRPEGKALQARDHILPSPTGPPRRPKNAIGNRDHGPCHRPGPRRNQGVDRVHTRNTFLVPIRCRDPFPWDPFHPFQASLTPPLEPRPNHTPGPENLELPSIYHHPHPGTAPYPLHPHAGRPPARNPLPKPRPKPRRKPRPPPKPGPKPRPKPRPGPHPVWKPGLQEGAKP
jgi:hypothetical protein